MRPVVSLVCTLPCSGVVPPFSALLLAVQDKEASLLAETPSAGSHFRHAQLCFLLYLGICMIASVVSS